MKHWHFLGAAFALAGLAGTAHGQIVVGQTVGVTGSVAATVKEAATGASLFIDSVNASGGIKGEKIQVVTLDDKFDVKQTVENARILIEDKKAVVLFMNRGTPHTEALLPLLSKYKIALVGPSTGAMVMHNPVQPYVFNVRSTYQREAQKAVDHLHTLGLTRIAVVHVDDSFGLDGLEGANKGFEKAKIKAAVVVKADRAKPDYTKIVPPDHGRQRPGRDLGRLRHGGDRRHQGAAQGGLSRAGGDTFQQCVRRLHQAAGRCQPRRDHHAGVPL